MILNKKLLSKKLQVETKFDLINRNPDLYELSKLEDKSIAEILKKDLEDLSYVMRKNQGIKYDDEDDSLLMVIIKNQIL